MLRFFLLLVFFFCSLSSTGQQAKCKCCTVNHSAFDFWIGTWEVTNADGTKAGQNTITRIEGNCALRENWISATPGYTGTSLNFYNTKSGFWEQLWIDNSGTQLKLSGKRIGNQMILASEEFEHSDGKLYINRITWTANNDGTVRQLWEVLQENKVVNVLFDGLYKKTE